jgi:hypothetical protein
LPSNFDCWLAGWLAGLVFYMNNTGELFLFPFLEPGYNHHLLSASWKNIKITKKKILQDDIRLPCKGKTAIVAAF